MTSCDRGCSHGHLFVAGKWYRCQCLENELNRKELGIFATNSPKTTTRLVELIDTSLLIEGPLFGVREHIAGALLHLKAGGKTFTSMDAYRLVEIFLDKDLDYKSTSDLADYDLYVMLLGFGDIKNQRLPDIIMQALERRRLMQKPSWVVLGIPLGQVLTRYSQEVYDVLASFKKVTVR